LLGNKNTREIKFSALYSFRYKSIKKFVLQSSWKEMKCFITRLCVSTLLRTLALKANAIALMIIYCSC